MSPQLISIVDDRTLLNQYATGRDADAFAELARRYSGFVFSIARRITGNVHDAEDVTQQCFLELARRAATVTAPIAGWLHRVACSRSLNARRDKATRWAYEAAIPPRRSEPPDEPTWSELEPLIDEAIAALPDDQRLPLVLHYLKQKSQTEVASELGLDQSTISRRLSQGIAALRLQLEKAGVVVAAAALSTLLVSHPVHAAPPALIASLTKVGIAGIGYPVAGLSLAAVKWAVAFLLFLGAALGAYAVLRTQPQNQSQAAPAPRQPAAPLPNVGIIRDLAGNPVSNVLIAGSTAQIWTGIRTDANGQFGLNEVGLGQGRHFAYSQRTGKMAEFSLATLPPNSPVSIVLNSNVASADGCVVTPGGAPIAGATVHIFMTNPDGQTFLLATCGQTNDSGYYAEGVIPSMPGVKIRASLSISPGIQNSTPPIDTNGLYQIEFPDLVDHSGMPPSRHPGPKRDHYSGRVVDETGMPVEGAIVSMSYPMNHMIAEGGDVITDAQGHFSRLLPPDAVDPISIRLLHPEYCSYHFAGDVHTDAASLREGSAVIVMKKGFPITGVVRDESGKAVLNALVLGGQAYSETGGDNEPIEDCTTARTDSQGRFRIGGLPLGSNRVEVLSEGFAPALASFDLTRNAAPLEIPVNPGAPFSAKVVDATGRPLVAANISCREWATHSNHVPLARFTKTDATGQFILQHLPREGELSMYAGHKGFLSSDFKWSAQGKNDDLITLYRPPIVTGFVRDADTDEPIRKFDVQPGFYWSADSEFDLSSFDGTSHVKASDGKFSKKIQRFVFSRQFSGVAVRIIADGYLPVISPKVMPGHPYEPFVIHLKKASPVTGVVKTITGVPVADATVFLVEPTEIVGVEGLSIEENLTKTAQLRTKTDSKGNFKLPPSAELAHVFVLHESGYALVYAKSIEQGGAITLTPWARVEGIFRIAGKPISGVQLGLFSPNAFNPIQYDLRTATRADGKFEFDYVPAMPFTIYRNDVVPGGSRQTPVEPQPGKVVTVELGDAPASSQP
jgi:RNA polymerase sigma factor (sigma-70 family)